MPSVHANLRFHLSEVTKNKIISGAYVDLASLLSDPMSEYIDIQLTVNQLGELVFKPINLIYQTLLMIHFQLLLLATLMKVHIICLIFLSCQLIM